uniref:Vesicle transport protein n=1 Tax=Chrysotila carterae TaxID=13221 RepID=A0A7S4BE42_CHRCT
MESFRFMAGMGVDAAMEHIQKTQSRAKEQMERMSSDMSTGVSRIRASATEIASIDLSKLELAGSIDRLKESACSGLEAGSTVSANGESSACAAGARTEEDSESGGEDAAKANGNGFGSYLAPSIASRLGYQQQRNVEKEQLVPKKGAATTESPLSLSAISRMSSSFGGSVSRGISSMGSSVRESMSSNVLLGSSTPKEPEGMVGRLCSCCPALTYQQRMLGFVICFILGGILSLSALSSLPGLLIGNPAPFAFKYTAGNLLSIGSSSFLVGPVKQCRDMSAPERSTASLIYIVTLVGTLLSVFVLKVQILTFLLVVLQMCSLTWYMLSYVPYGQQCVRRIIRRFQ